MRDEDLEQARAALKAGRPEDAIRLYRKAQANAPRNAEIAHELGLAHLELGDVGLAALAQRRALELDAEHAPARAQLVAMLGALGDDAGAARELAALLARIGPQLALEARRAALEDAARRAAQRRLLGSAPSRLAQSPLVTSAMAQSMADSLLFRASFAELRAQVQSGAVRRLDLGFQSMDASMGRSDLAYGGATTDEEGRRVPLDEFSAAAIVFLSEALGIETTRARRLLRFLLTPECGMTPQPVAGARVGWTISGEGEDRRYGLFAEL